MTQEGVANIRVIGIRHRRKRTEEDEARPTQLYITDGTKSTKLDLETDTEELDFVRHRLPESFRDAMPDEDLSKIPAHHRKLRRLRASDDRDQLVLVEEDEEGKRFDTPRALRIPESYTGLKAGDQVAMIMGGSGDRLAYSLARYAQRLGGGTHIMRLPAYALKDRREAVSLTKDDDAQVLAEMLLHRVGRFYETTPRDMENIKLKLSWLSLKDTMADRIACGQRVLQRRVGNVFLADDDAGYPEGSLEDDALKALTNSPNYQALVGLESQAQAELEALIEQHPVYVHILSKVTGIGPRLAVRIIANIGDIRRFETMARFKAYCGVHVKKGGKYADVPPERSFPRARRGDRSNWQRDVRQSAYLFGEQTVKRKKAYWGKALLVYKAWFREQHPEEIKDDKGKSRYSNGHIHKMGLWRTRTKFFEWLYRQWWRLERGQAIFIPNDDSPYVRDADFGRTQVAAVESAVIVDEVVPEEDLVEIFDVPVADDEESAELAASGAER
jgi:hypothetical protein